MKITDRVQHAHDTMALIPESVYDQDVRLVGVYMQLKIILDYLEKCLCACACEDDDE